LGDAQFRPGQLEDVADIETGRFAVGDQRRLSQWHGQLLEVAQRHLRGQRAVTDARIIHRHRGHHATGQFQCRQVMDGDRRILVGAAVPVAHRDLIDQFGFGRTREAFQREDIGGIQHHEAGEAVVRPGELQGVLPGTRMDIERAIDVAQHFADELFEGLFAIPQQGESELFAAQRVGRRRETAGIDLAGRVPQTPGRIVEALVDDMGRIGVTVDVAATQGRRCRNSPCFDAPGLDVGVHR